MGMHCLVYLQNPCRFLLCLKDYLCGHFFLIFIAFYLTEMHCQSHLPLKDGSQMHIALI